MDTAAIIIKIVGLGLFVFTAHSVYKHVRGKMRPSVVDTASPTVVPTTKDSQGNTVSTIKGACAPPSRVEYVLNAILLYAWFTFMTALSLGMIFNN